MKKYTNDSPTFRSELDIVDTSTPDNGDNISLADRQNFDNILVLSKRIGTLNSLSTKAKTSLVAAINEIFTKADGATDEIGTLSSLETEGKSSIVAAVNELLGTIRKDMVRLDSLEKSANILTYHGAGPHNAIYRGKYLGEALTAEQSATISAGEFEDLYIGDYWTIGGVNYRIAAFDYYYNCGDTKFKKHHAVIVPDTSLYSAIMYKGNEEDKTGGFLGAYAGSTMRKSNLEQARTIIKAAFGPAHVLTKREKLVYRLWDGGPGPSKWYDSDVELMSEVQAYGTVIFRGRSCNYSNNGTGASQFPLFMFDPTKLHNNEGYWLRDVASHREFSIVEGNGNLTYCPAPTDFGVRPAFCIG